MPFRKRKEQEEPTMPEQKVVPITKSKETMIEEIFEQIVDREYLSISPNDGSYVSAVRTVEVYDILCNYFGVDGSNTKFKDYS